MMGIIEGYRHAALQMKVQFTTLDKENESLRIHYLLISINVYV